MKLRLIDHIRQRTPLERSFHALSYEIIGVVTSAPLISLISGKPMGESGVLAVVVAVMAMIWNYIFNLLFDKLQEKYRFNRNLFVRILHGMGFEVGLIGITVPVIALIFKMNLIDAFILELGMLIYFFPYTIVFNWIYDKIRLGYIKRYDRLHGSTHPE